MAGETPVGGGTPVVSLSEPEERLLRELKARPDPPWTEAELVERLEIPMDTVRGSLQRLRSKHLAVVDEESTEVRRLSSRGEQARRTGLPERRLAVKIRDAGGSLDPARTNWEGFTDEERTAAIGVLRRRGLLSDGVPWKLAKSNEEVEVRFPEERTLEQVANDDEEVDESVLASLKRRGLVVVEHRAHRRWSLSEEGRSLPLPESSSTAVGPLTPRLLGSGEWKAVGFRPYDVRATVPYLSGARPHPYLAWVREFEEILVGLGFEQAEGPLLETEFWNADVLFMPQEHPSRSIHDVLSVQGASGRAPPAELLDRVAAVHEGRPLPGEAEAITPGWRAPYSRAIAARPVLRSQTTAVSARFLARGPKPPFRMFSIDRNFRRDSVDATHHVEFGQCEGIVGAEGIHLRHLVGIFRELAEAIGIRELKIRPSYFPFTEPSIEGYVRHPRLGWIEVFPGGLFRPEVLRPLGVEVPVAAWGIGVTRLAMVALGVSDIRDLFEDDLERLTTGGP